MKLSAEELTLLKYIAVERNGKTTMPDIGRHYIGSSVNYREIREEELERKNLLDVDSLNVSVSPDGELYLKEYNSFGRDEIYDNYDEVLYRFLYELNEPLRTDAFPEILKKEVPPFPKALPLQNTASKLADYVTYSGDSKLKRYIDRREHVLFLNNDGREYYEHLMSKSERDQKNQMAEILNWQKKAITELNKKPRQETAWRNVVEATGMPAEISENIKSLLVADNNMKITMSAMQIGDFVRMEPRAVKVLLGIADIAVNNNSSVNIAVHGTVNGSIAAGNNAPTNQISSSTFTDHLPKETPAANTSSKTTKAIKAIGMFIGSNIMKIVIAIVSAVILTWLGLKK